MVKLFLYQIILSLFLSLPAFAQTKTEIQRKYKIASKPISNGSIDSQIYEIRKGIFADFFYDKNEAATRITFEQSAGDDETAQIEMPYPIVEELLEELVPQTRRGKLCGNFDFESGRNIYRLAMYEKVLINLDFHNSTIDDSKATVGKVEIKFSTRNCPKVSEEIIR